MKKLVMLMIVAIAFVGLMASTSSADVITPTGVTTTGGNLGGRPIGTTIDGSGLIGDGDILTQTHNVATGSEYWISASGNTSGIQFDFDLGGTFSVDSVHLWNYAPGNNTTDRGLNTVDIAFSTDNGINYSAPFTISFAEAVMNVPAPVDTVSFSAANDVTNIRFTNSTNHGNNSYTAFSEIRFGSAPAAMDPNPANGDDNVGAADPLTLSWTNLDPNSIDPNLADETVYVDIWWGTTEAGMVKLQPGLEAISEKDVDSSDIGTYYWRVDTIIGDANMLPGNVWSYTTVGGDAPEVSIETVDSMTWSDNSVALEATVNDSSSTLSYGWTAVPDGLDNDKLTVEFESTEMTPVVTITNTTGEMVTVTMILTASNDENPAISEAFVEIDVYADACDMAINGEGLTLSESDINEDCVTNFQDLALMASEWLVDIASPGIAPQ